MIEPGVREELALLNCMSNYPVPIRDYSICAISDTIAHWLSTGLYDRTGDNTTITLSVAAEV